MRVLGLILAGGQSSRMGEDKALVKLGSESLLSRAVARLTPQVEALAISANRPVETDFPVLADERPGEGPLGGVLAGLAYARANGFTHVLTVAVDTPFFPPDLAQHLPPAGVAKDHPTFALWPVGFEAGLRAALDAGDRKLRRVMAGLGFVEVALGDEAFFNVNTRGELAEAEKRLNARPPMLGIVGFKNSGKTTLTERLVTELTARGYRVSTIKHAHHAFDIDHPGRDSWRHRQAGAQEVAVVSGARLAYVRELRGAPEPPLLEVAARLLPCDLILTEGYKWESHPKIEVRNLELSHPELAGNDPTVIALAASAAVEAPVPVFSREDATGLCDFIERHLGLRHGSS